MGSQEEERGKRVPASALELLAAKAREIECFLAAWCISLRGGKRCIFLEKPSSDFSLLSLPFSVERKKSRSGKEACFSLKTYRKRINKKGRETDYFVPLAWFSLW